MKGNKSTLLYEAQTIHFFIDSRFAGEKNRVSHLYKQLLNKKISFVDTIEEAEVTVLFSSKMEDSFVIDAADSLMILAGNPLTAFRGMMHLANQLKNGAKIESGKMQESLAERIVMLDIGRKYFSPEILHQMLEQMSLYGFNYLQLHFSENTGFRIESVHYPEVVSAEFLTVAEIEELIQYASYLSIEIIPDFDTPGHMEHLLKKHPEWQLTMITKQGEYQKVPSALDITNEQGVSFVLSLYQEYMDLFADSRYFHIGGDEFVDFEQLEQYPALADNGLEKFEAYVNKVATFVSDHGFIPRVWNDAFFRNEGSSSLTKAAEITYWTKWQKEMAPVQMFLDKGYSVINFNDNYLYYVLGENAGYTYPVSEKIKDDWHPNMFASDQWVSSRDRMQVKGATLAVWCDRPDAKNEKEILSDLIKLMEGISHHFYKME
ncbi:family 20 glycosylhydrolase [Enterococcus quebecensis]|uniref:Glycoside hydrolase family 20 catalytic domain-containing protein n=1 Tax=Enterococcus quebecensis TaxID=903983 RepID=A0A1E5GSE7_9ENTE|nr:family 20 glycosylhydrolase [Enterococcus quebecensis]OEG15627.1 hypothetical protein BCR23_09180 [Enterococcus quebecensis]